MDEGAVQQHGSFAIGRNIQRFSYSPAAGEDLFFFLLYFTFKRA